MNMKSDETQTGDERDPAGDLPAGTLIDDRFELVEYVAGGGMGFIYRARMLSTGHVVAVKVMREQLRFDPTAVKRFQREAKTVSRLFHPNTITLHDFGTNDDGLMYIVMEWLEGTDLAQMLADEGPFSPVRAARIGSQVASSLHEAHQKGIVHRDLKPENIFMVRAMKNEDFVKVLDFGIAKIVDGPAQTQITRLGMVCVTPDFMSPEQGRGEELDGRSDVYALGCVLFTLLTGEVPFPSDNPIRAVMQHQLEAFPDLPPGFPVALNRLLKRATEKDREDRFRSAFEMAESLDAFVDRMTGATREQTDEIPVMKADDSVDALGATVVSQPQIERLTQANEPADVKATVVMPKQGDVVAARETKARSSTYVPTSTTEMHKPAGLRVALIVGAVLLLGGLAAAAILLTMDRDNTRDDASSNQSANNAQDSAAADNDSPSEETPQPVLAVAVVSSRPVEATLVDPDGKTLGKTPVTVESEQAINGVFTASAEGYEPLKRMVRVQPGDQVEVELHLTAIPPVRCVVRSSPRKATITRDGNVMGQTPLAFDIPTGASWELALSLDRYQPATVNVTGEEPCLAVVDLKPKPSSRKRHHRRETDEEHRDEAGGDEAKTEENEADDDGKGDDEEEPRFKPFD